MVPKGQKHTGSRRGSHWAPCPHGFGSQGFRCSTQPRMVLGLSRKPGRQVHLANPFGKTVHCVFGPHGDGLQGLDGSMQGTCGGVPSNSGKQKQTALSPTTRQPEFGPQGFGVHSSPSGTTTKLILQDVSC